MLFDPAEQDTVIIPIGVTPPINVVAIVTVLGSISCLVVGLRVWTRTVILKSFGWDDILMVIALMFYMVYNVAFVMGHVTVTGHSTLTLREFKNAVVYLLIAEHFYTLNIMILKVSLGVFFLRIMIFRWQRWVIYAAMAVSTTIGTAYFFVGVFQCGYFSNIWIFLSRRVTLEGCIPVTPALGVAYTQASVAALTDWIYAILPLFLLYNAQMKRREKNIVFGILSLAAAGSIASLVRFKYIPALVESTEAFFPHSLGIAIWSGVEIGLGIIAGSLATLRPLFRKVFQLGPKSTNNSQSSGAQLSNSQTSGAALLSHNEGTKFPYKSDPYDLEKIDRTYETYGRSEGA